MNAAVRSWSQAHGRAGRATRRRRKSNPYSPAVYGRLAVNGGLYGPEARRVLLPPRSPLWRRWFGTRSERGGRLFASRDLRVLEHNFTCELGEIDISRLDGQCVVFRRVLHRGERHDGGGGCVGRSAKQQQLTQRAVLLEAGAGCSIIRPDLSVLAVSCRRRRRSRRLCTIRTRLRRRGGFRCLVEEY